MRFVMSESASNHSHWKRRKEIKVYVDGVEINHVHGFDTEKGEVYVTQMNARGEPEIDLATGYIVHTTIKAKKLKVKMTDTGEEL